MKNLFALIILLTVAGCASGPDIKPGPPPIAVPPDPPAEIMKDPVPLKTIKPKSTEPS